MINISNNLRSALQSLYGLKNPSIVKKIESGYKAESFVIQDGDNKFFVKKYHSKRSRERLLEIHRVKKFFGEHDVPTIPPLVNSKGETLSEVDGIFFSVFPYVPDRQYYALPSDKAVASAGENLARIHLAGVNNLSLVHGKCREPWNKENFLKNTRRMLELADAGTTSFDKIARKMLALKIKLAKDSNILYEELGLKNDTILHGDYHTHNLFFDEHDDVSYTFDFERTMMGSRTTDVAYGLFMICFDFNTDIENDVSEIHFERAHSFLRAYNKIFPIGLDEFTSGVRWFFWSQIVYIEWPIDVHYFDGCIHADKLLPKRFNRLEYFSSNFDATIDAFQKFLLELLPTNKSKGLTIQGAKSTPFNNVS